MGCEYVIRLNEEDTPISAARLEETLSQLPHYFGKASYPDKEAFQFRTEATLGDTDAMPDLEVTVMGLDIVLCQYGDYQVTVHVLGAIVAECVTASKHERIEVIKP